MSNKTTPATEPVTLDRAEIVSRGKEINRQISQKPEVAAFRGHRVAIDVLSGDYEVAIHDDDTQIAERIRRRRPGAALFIGRIGAPVTYIVGATWR